LGQSIEESFSLWPNGNVIAFEAQSECVWHIRTIKQKLKYLNLEVIESAAGSSVASFYDQYASWCNAQHKHPRNKVQFRTALQSQSYALVRDSTGRYCQGLTTFMVT